MNKNSAAVAIEPCLKPNTQAWVVVGPCLFDACISSLTFDGGILKTGADVTPGSWVPLKLANGDERFTVHIQIFAGANGRHPFRLYGTTGVPRSLWDALVRERRDQGL